MQHGTTTTAATRRESDDERRARVESAVMRGRALLGAADELAGQLGAVLLAELFPAAA